MALLKSCARNSEFAAFVSAQALSGSAVKERSNSGRASRFLCSDNRMRARLRLAPAKSRCPTNSGLIQRQSFLVSAFCGRELLGQNGVERKSRKPLQRGISAL